ncbi:MAG TPA: DinB family protein [Gemmatimonadales bacterium]|nr:DinB family protein [Gemmatimonadales bacterium]
MLQLDQAKEILAQTPGTLRALVGTLSPVWLTCTEGPDTWSPRDVVAHLADLEQTDWIPRARIILEHGDTRPFDPVDRIAFQTAFAGWPIQALLDTFEQRRRRNLETLEGWKIGPEQLDRRGAHPALGPVSLGQLLATWAVHDLTHLSQIVRVLAHRYDAAVGPWREYLTVLKQTGSGGPS